MLQHAGRLEEELMNMKKRLTAAEGERDRARDQLTEMKKMADETNTRLTEAMSNGKVADVFTELNSVTESLSKSNQKLKTKEKAIASLKVELEKVEELEAKLVEKDALLEKLKEELSSVKSSEAQVLDLLSKSKKRIQELEAEVETGKETKTKMLDSFSAQTKQHEQTKILLEESRLEITSLCEKVEKLEGSRQKHDEVKFSLQEELESLKSKLQLARENLACAQEGEKHSGLKGKSLLEEMELLKNELKQATEAEENSKKAMDDLALALKEVATEANQAKEKLILTQEDLEHFKKETEELKEKLKSIEDKHKTLLDELRKEADRYRNTAERLRLEAEESLLAWNGKEMGFVDCIKIAEEEKKAALEENTQLLELLRAAEEMSNKAKLETQKLRDILKQALNEANVAKEAAEIARAENSQLKDVLAQKDDALIFITQENENLRINEAAALENIKELKGLLSEASGKEFKVEDKEHEHKQKPQNPMEKEHRDGRKLSNGFSFNLKELIIPHKHKDVDEDQKIPDKNSNNDENEDSENTDPLRGSIFDVAESPVATVHQQKKTSSAFTDDKEAVNSENYDNIDGAHIDDFENERNSRKKRALLRRFGEILTRRRPVHRREPSVGGDQDHKKESSVGE